MQPNETTYVEACKAEDNNFANARFLDLKETVDEGGERKVSKVVSGLAAETSLRKMVKDLNDAFEKHDIDMSIFKPNQFAFINIHLHVVQENHMSHECVVESQIA